MPTIATCKICFIYSMCRSNCLRLGLSHDPIWMLHKGIGLLQTKSDKTLAANPKIKVSRIHFIFMDIDSNSYIVHIHTV